MNWYFDVIRKYAEFAGRARRKEYWMFALVNMIVFVAINLLGVLGRIIGIGAVLSSLLMLLFFLAILLPATAVAIRRMHDIGKSGWWILVPVANLVFACIDSQPGDNEYGPNPKAA